jgi:hypothetical protein
MAKGANRMSGLTAREAVSGIKQRLGDEWLPKIYQREVLAGRSRSYRLDIQTRVKDPGIIHTLLGIELTLGRRRLLIPDLATARYLSVFARVGVTEVAIPYDITKVSRLADRLESSIQRTLLLAEQFSLRKSQRSGKLVQSQLLDDMRAEIQLLGGGQPFPTFDTSTKQRR